MSRLVQVWARCLTLRLKAPQLICKICLIVLLPAMAWQRDSLNQHHHRRRTGWEMVEGDDEDQLSPSTPNAIDQF